MPTFQERIKQIREDHDLTLDEFAKLFNTHRWRLATGKEYDRDNRVLSPMARELIEQIEELDDKEIKAVFDFLKIIRDIK